MYRVFVSLFLGMLLLAGCGKDSTVSLPEVSLSLSAIEVTTASDVEVTAKLNKIAEKPVTVRLEFSGTAESGKHYIAQHSTITIPGGSLLGTITITFNEVTNTTPLDLIISIASVEGAVISQISEASLVIVKEEDVVVKGIAVKLLPSQEKQTISGFGGIVVPDWGNNLSEAEGELAFGIGAGKIGMSLLRLRISPDPNQFNRILSVATQAQSMGVTLFASPWTPPAYMKTSNNVIGGELKKEYYGDYAAHLKSFVDYLSGKGIPLYAVSIQNEPDIKVDYESCDWSSAQMIDFLTHHARSIGEVKIMAPESFQFRQGISNAILNDESAANNLDIIGGHIYGGGLQDYPLAHEKGKEVWMTEHFINEDGAVSEWKEAMMVAQEINDCMEANMNAYVWWYIKRFYGPIDESGSVSKKGFVMSHYARFVRPGFVRVGVNIDPSKGVFVTAYKKEDQLVMVFINTNKSTVKIEVEGTNINELVSYVTTSTINCEEMNTFQEVQGKFELSLKTNSITTFVSR